MDQQKSSISLPHIVIVGGGFGGLAAARALGDAPVRIRLVDRRNHHLFQPLLYQVATAALNPGDIASPIRRILRRQANVEVILGEAVSIDPSAHKVILRDGEIAYDYLIIASGATHSYFGHEAWERYAPGLKTVEDALEIRRRVLVAYEAAEREPDLEIMREWMTFAIVGAGHAASRFGTTCSICCTEVIRSKLVTTDPKDLSMQRWSEDLFAPARGLRKYHMFAAKNDVAPGPGNCVRAVAVVRNRRVFVEVIKIGRASCRERV